MNVNFEKLTEKEKDAALCIIANGYKTTLETDSYAYRCDELTEENKEMYLDSVLNATDVFFDLLAGLYKAEVTNDESDC